MQQDFLPFQNDTQTTNVGPGDGLTFENGTDSIVIYGNVEISKDTPQSQLDSLINILQNIKNQCKPELATSVKRQP